MIKLSDLLITGLRASARRALLARQPKTRLEALAIKGVGRKTVLHLIRLGLIMDRDREPQS